MGELHKASIFDKNFMIENKKIKDSQSWGKYVLYYIFYKDSPVYVGITNNFKLRKGQHFNKSFREKESRKKLYKHMEENDIDDYSMYVVAQCNKVEDIEELEKSHIKELKKFNLADMNVAKGGNYNKETNFDFVVESLKIFRSDFKRIEKTINDYYDIDIDKLSLELENLDWELLYSIVNCKEHSVIDSYERYCNKGNEDNLLSFEAHLESVMEFIELTYPDGMAPTILLSNVLTKKSILSNIKENSIMRFVSAIEYLEDSEDAIEVYIGIKCLLGQDYEDILPSLSVYGDYYDIIEKLETVLKEEILHG